MTFICWLAIGGCASHAAPPDVRTDNGCSKNAESRPPTLRVVNINITGRPAEPIKVAPDPVCVRPGDVLWFKINGNRNKVTVEGKEEFDAWIAGSSKLSWFYVVVPLDLLPESVEDFERLYYYNVSHDDDVLDPEVRVRRDYH
jgi:hypothetical protein